MRAIHIHALLLLIATCAFAADAPSTQPSQVGPRLTTDTSLHDLRDHSITPLDLPAGHRAAVLIFISTDCPISNGYAPLIAELCHTFSQQGIDFYTVYEDSSLTPAAATAHHDSYAFPCDALLDPQQTLAHVAGATVTPETIVVGPGGRLLYRGRIDNQYAAVGRKRFSATTHELKDALAEITADQPVTVASMPAVGCAIP